MSSDQVWSITSSSPLLTQPSMNLRTTSMLRSFCVSLPPPGSGIIRLLLECECVFAQGGRVERGGDPAGRAVGSEFAERRHDVGERVWALRPDVEVGSAAIELPARCHQDRF